MILTLEFLWRSRERERATAYPTCTLYLGDTSWDLQKSIFFGGGGGGEDYNLPQIVYISDFLWLCPSPHQCSAAVCAGAPRFPRHRVPTLPPNRDYSIDCF